MQKAHIGLIGAGLIAREHVQCMNENPRVGTISVYDIDQSRAEERADEAAGRVAPSEEALLADCDVVWICTPPAFHRQSIERACAEGKPVFCEKPLAITREDLKAIQEAVKTADVPFFMGQSARWSDPFRKMRDHVLKGTVGELVHVGATRVGYLDQSVHPAWRLDDSVSGGVIVELGVHEIDFIQWLGGKWQEVCASGSSRILAPGRFLDSVHATGMLDGGATALLDISWAEPRYLWQRTVRGTEGAMLVDDQRFTQVELWRPMGKEPEIIEAVNWRHSDTGENMALREQLEGVVSSLLDQTPFPVTLEDGVSAVEAALTVRAAATV